MVDHIISVTGSVPSADRSDYAISATSSHYSHSAIEAGSANYATESNHTHSADSATYDSLGRKIVDTYLTAHQELPDWTPTIQNASGNAYNSAVNWVVDQHYLTAVTGDNTPYSAGPNIAINDHVVSGKDWTSEIQDASANAVAQIPTGLIVTSGLEYDGDNYITGYSGSAFGGQGSQGVEYEGIAPIVVNNVEHKISAQSAKLGVQEPLYFVEDSESATIIGISGLPEVEGVMYESALDMSGSVITGYNGSAIGGTVEITGQYIPYTEISTGHSGTTVYNVASGIRVTAASGWTEMYNQNKENENEAHLQVAQNYTGNKSFWAELDGAGGGFLQMNWNSGTVSPNAHSSYSDGTTASLDIVNGAIVYRTAAHSLTATGEGGDGENKIWQLGFYRLRFWDSAGNTAAVFGPEEYSAWNQMVGSVPSRVVATTAQATGSDILYIVTGS